MRDTQVMCQTFTFWNTACKAFSKKKVLFDSKIRPQKILSLLFINSSKQIGLKTRDQEKNVTHGGGGGHVWF